MYLLLSLGLLIADQYTKYLARTHLAEGPLRLLGEQVQLSLHYNHGIAFSLPVPVWLSSALSVLVIAVVVWQLWRRPYSALYRVAGVLLLNGAVGNLLDRLIAGKVTDFIAVGGFPIFNLADTWVSLAVLLYAVAEWQARQR
ncbi:signal peptidase II [Candidatus Peribacteria bacterium]|nr:signal peptidase II [Candidatus Peribacteria bacterium]